MSINSSSSSNASHSALRPISLYDEVNECYFSEMGIGSTIVFSTVNNVFLLPLFIVILSLGAHRWRQQHQRTKTHSEVFTVHIVAAELIGVASSTIICSASVTGMKAVMIVGLYSCSVYHFLILSLQMLTCVERYLAVVHPIIYVGLRNEKGVRIRNASIAFSWFLTFVEAAIALVAIEALSIYTTIVLSLHLVVVSFCSLSVLRALYQSNPRREGGGRHIDALRLRAFYTIFIVLGALLLRFGFNAFAVVVLWFSDIDEHYQCVLWLSSFWFGLPSVLVAPLLFLQKQGKLCCRSRRSRQRPRQRGGG